MSQSISRHKKKNGAARTLTLKNRRTQKQQRNIQDDGRTKWVTRMRRPKTSIKNKGIRGEKKSILLGVADATGGDSLEIIKKKPITS